MTRRGFLGGLGGVVAAAVAPKAERHPQYSHIGYGATWTPESGVTWEYTDTTVMSTTFDGCESGVTWEKTETVGGVSVNEAMPRLFSFEHVVEDA